MNVLFICVYNRFRSRVAEALFNHHNKDSSHAAKSAGISVDQTGYPILGVAGKVLKDMGVRVEEKGGAQQVSDNLIEWADKIVIVAEEIPIEMFPTKKTVKFACPDEYADERETWRTIQMIEKGVLSVLKSISSLKV